MNVFIWCILQRMKTLIYKYAHYVIKMSENSDMFHEKTEYLFLKLLGLFLLCRLTNVSNSNITKRHMLKFYDSKDSLFMH